MKGMSILHNFVIIVSCAFDSSRRIGGGVAPNNKTLCNISVPRVPSGSGHDLQFYVIRSLNSSYEESLKISKVYAEAVNRRRTDTTIHVHVTLDRINSCC